MVNLKVTNSQAKIINEALEFYFRVGMGQFKEILTHPTFYNHLRKEFSYNENIEYDKLNITEKLVLDKLTEARNLLYGSDCYNLPSHGSWSLYNENVDENCRIANDIYQCIRHEFWKISENKSNISVASNKSLSSVESDKIEVNII